MLQILIFSRTSLILSYLCNLSPFVKRLIEDFLKLEKIAYEI